MRPVVELTMTLAPRCSRVLAAANPIPPALPAPVTRARLPASEIDTALDGNQSRDPMVILKALGLLGALVIVAVVTRFVLGPDVRMYRLPSVSMSPTYGARETV